MTERVRFILLVTVNITIALSFILVSSICGFDITTKRLSDINFTQSNDLHLFLFFIMMLVIAFTSNWLIFSAKSKNEHIEELEQLVKKFQKLSHLH